MFSAFSARLLDPPFVSVSIANDEEEPNPDLPGEYLQELLAKKCICTTNLLTCDGGALANVAGASFIEKDGLAVLATGEITNSQELCELYNISPLPESSVELLACLYEKEFTDVYGDCSDQPMTAIASFEGPFAFMMYDSSSGYFLAARSACGREKFFWGTSEVREDIVLLSSVQDGLTDFPPGCMFESRGDGTGDLENFTRHTPKRRQVNAMPKVDSHGHLCAMKYTTPSGHDLQAMVGQQAVEL